MLGLKTIDAITHGAYSNLKRLRLRHAHGTYVRANAKHVEGVLEAFGLDKANASKTPHFSEERPAIDPPLGKDAAA